MPRHVDTNAPVMIMNLKCRNVNRLGGGGGGGDLSNINSGYFIYIIPMPMLMCPHTFSPLTLDIETFRTKRFLDVSLVRWLYNLHHHTKELQNFITILDRTLCCNI